MTDEPYVSRYDNKTEPIKIHALKRAKERMGEDSTREDLCNMARMIQGGGPTTIVENVSKMIKIHEIEYKGRWWRVVYDKKRGLIKTIIPISR